MTHSKKSGFLATALAGAALIAPAAQARPIDDPALPPAATARFAVAPSVLSGSQPQAASSADTGFDWGDAGIGAAVTLSLLGLGAGTAGALRRSRHTRPAVS